MKAITCESEVVITLTMAEAQRLNEVLKELSSLDSQTPLHTLKCVIICALAGKQEVMAK